MSIRALLAFSVFALSIASAGLPGCENQPQSAEPAGRMDVQADGALSPSTSPDPRVAAFLDEGDANYQDGRWIEAAKAYSAALEIDAGNSRAAEGLNASLAQIDQGSRIGEVEQMLELRAAAAIAEFDAGYQRSLEALEKHELELARGTILHARATLLRNQELIPPGEFKPRDNKAAELLQSIDRVEELHARSGR